MMETVIVVLIITVGGLPWVAAPLLIVCFTRYWLSVRWFRPHPRRGRSAALFFLAAVVCLIVFNVFIDNIQRQKPPVISAVFEEVVCWSCFLISLVAVSVSLALFSKAKTRTIFADCCVIIFGSLAIYIILFWNLFLTTAVI